MYKIFNRIGTWLASVFAAEPSRDPLDAMSPQELADLPVHHPRFDCSPVS